MPFPANKGHQSSVLAVREPALTGYQLKKKQESKEQACTETEREMFGRFLDATDFLQPCFYRFYIKGN